MKVFYLFLIAIHLMIFKHFLGSFDFAFSVIQYKGEWEQSGIFPRVTVCDFSVCFNYFFTEFIFYFIAKHVY